jgi:hypothetical protein
MSLPGPDDPAVGLDEPWLLQDGGQFVVGRWSLTPKLATDGWWFAHFWDGPGSRIWRGSLGGVPEEAARFAAAGDAEAAYKMEHPDT